MAFESIHRRYYLTLLVSMFIFHCFCALEGTATTPHTQNGSGLLPQSSTQTDAEALLQLKAQIVQDPSGILVGWVSNGGSSNPCVWHGVTCNLGNRVVVLNLSNAGLAGPLSVSSIASLDMLQKLDLFGNAFSGNLTGLCAITGICGSLQSVNLGGNSLGGMIPGELLACRGMQELILADNNFTGNFPVDFSSNCGSLQLLNLSHNHLNGPLPPGIGECSSLQQLDLSKNSFSGGLPLDLLIPTTNCMNCSGKRSRLQTIDLSCNYLSGSIPNSIFSNCGDLISIDLSSNGFSGGIPATLENCNSLQSLNLSLNQLGSHLPPSLGSLQGIEGLYLSNNGITGPIPDELGKLCSTLVELDLSMNNITGTIPASFGSCSHLQTLNLANNDLSGTLPIDVLSPLQSLENLLLSFNSFTGGVPLGMIGAVPIGISNCTNLKVLDLSSNQLNGKIPPEICPPAFPLTELYFTNNHISGEVPPALANCSHLEVLDLSFNHLSGAIPAELCLLTDLETLFMWFNGLTGQVPSQFGSMPNLKNLVLNNNFLSGRIPMELMNCTSLEWLSLSSNKLTGRIPSQIGNMRMLSLLQLANNSFSGELPMELGNCTNLLWLDVNSNKLTGYIPPRLGRLAAGPPEHRTLVDNDFAFVRNLGPLCRGIGTIIDFRGIPESALWQTPLRKACSSTRLYKGISLNDNPDFSSIQVIDLSYNNLQGELREEMGYSHALQILDLSHNQLTGSIPLTFALLRNLGVLDLSYNKFEGNLSPLGNCSFLVQIDVSNNNFSGQIPSMGQLSTAPASGYTNNPGLCGEPLPPCHSNASHDNGSSDSEATSCGGSCLHKKLATLSWTTSVALGVLVSVACLCALGIWVIVKKKRNKRKDSSLLSSLHSSCNGTGSSSWNLSGEREPLSINVATFERPLRKLTFSQLIEATNGFNQDSLIGAGGFGEVYKAELKDGSVVAIKKLLQFSFQGDREFVAEMETLGKIKHRNLVPLLGYCKVGEERLLVYEYMQGGSLDEVLHGSKGRERLNWDLRKQIVRGAARGLAFLHHNCIPHIIHRDMKSSNVLLDKDLEARVSDFGMARLINALDTHLSVSTLAGTPGYVPPEYYQSFRCTAKGDVYSFGVILLELLTGKRPTDKEEFEDSNLVGWVKLHVSQNRSLEVLDAEIRGVGAEYEMLQYLAIACDCLEDLPARRPTMLQVLSMLKESVLEESC
eukprot:c20061_g1_i1 orf=227-3850(-)